MPRSLLPASGVAFALGGLLAGIVMLGGYDPRPLAGSGTQVTPVTEAAWVEVDWPLPPDPWGRGKAFRCAASHCGAELNVFVRPKLGFCNCATGVADDDELARIGDLNLLSYRLSAIGPGRPIQVAWMNGRSRAFAVDDPKGTVTSVVSIGFNDRCDAIVATVIAGRSEGGAAETRALALLNGRRVLGWIEVALGL